MARHHDPASGAVDPPSGTPGGAAAADLLSDVLRTVRLQGALFFLVEATSPWCVDVPRAADFAAIILPRARHLVSYHVIVEGAGLAEVPGAAPVAFGAGDVIVFPHADPYVMASAPGVPPELDQAETLDFFRALACGRLPFTITEGGGAPPPARFICGFLGCDVSPYNPLFAALPRLLHVPRRRSGESAGDGDMLDTLTGLIIAEAQAERPGAASIRQGLGELMFVEVLRRHLATAAPAGPSWLTGLRDPVAGRVLGLIHGAPAEDWSLERLSRAAGISRSVLAARFARAVGETPMRYLSLWRLQIAARRLSDTDEKVAAIGDAVGFASEAGFSRAFRKHTGRSPAQWRAELRGG